MPANGRKLRALIEQHLRGEGLDSRLCTELSKLVMTSALSWKAPATRSPAKAKAILAFSFGLRFDNNGNRFPGPINEELAQKVKFHYAQRARPVYAQWEIADLLAGTIAPEDLHSIRPTIRRERGDIDYLSTEGVLEGASSAGLSGKVHHPILIIAHRYHLFRCTLLAKGRALDVVTVPDEMPSRCDRESGQIWTASEIAYLVWDVRARLQLYRDTVLHKKMSGV